MKAYKAFNINENGDLQCRDMIYRIGETYEMDGLPIVCERGFHACLDINDLDGYYDIIDCHGLILGQTTVCEVELLGDIDGGYGDDEVYLDSKVATNKIKIVRQLSVGETLSKLNASDYSSRPEITMILDHSVGELTHDQLDVILQSDDVFLIKGVLEERSNDDYLLDKVVNHPKYGVRNLLLALNCYRDKDLDILVHDDDPVVRLGVAAIGRDKDLDILVHDEDYLVRSKVVKHGRAKDLDILVHDEKYLVRKAIAIYGRDEDLNILVHDIDASVRVSVAEHGRGKDLDIFVHDESYWVREAVAHQGRDKDLDILVHDGSSLVRETVAKRGRDKDLNILVDDCDVNVRIAAAHQRRAKDLDILVHDESYLVRRAVAHQGRAKDLNILIHDETDDVSIQNEDNQRG